MTYQRPKSHRVLAWIAIIILVAMYTVTLISAISGAGTTSALFMMSLGSTVVLPGLLWLYIRFWKFSMGRDRKTFGVEPGQPTGVREGAEMDTERTGADSPDTEKEDGTSATE
ncbi:MAG: hypothetical protein VZQ83_03135 [Eubacterium sp.]|nr:hypothetical protein [Eubacterium sp.]